MCHSSLLASGHRVSFSIIFGILLECFLEMTTFHTLVAISVPCCAVDHLRGLEEDDHFAVRCNIKFWCVQVTAQETQRVFVLHTIIIFVLREPSLRHYEELHVFLCVFREPDYGSVNRPCFLHFLTRLSSSFFFTYPLSFGLVTIALENVKCPWDVQTSMILPLCLLYLFLVLFTFNQLFINTTQRCALLQCQAVWEDISRPPEEWAPAVLWNCSPEHVQDPEELANCLQQMCHHSGNCRETAMTATCWGLAYAYCTLISAIQHTQERVREGL